MLVRPFITAVLILATYSFPVRIRAQQTTPSFTVLAAESVGWTTEADLRWPIGFVARLGLGRVELGYEGLSETRNYVGSTCAGFVPPGEDCSPESLNGSGRHSALYLAVVPFQRRAGRLRIDILPEIGIGRFEGMGRGQRSGRVLSDEATVVSLGVGGRMGYGLRRGIPLDLVLSLFWRAQFEPSFESCEDCYKGFSGLGGLICSMGLQLVIPRP